MKLKFFIGAVVISSVSMLSFAQDGGYGCTPLQEYAGILQEKSRMFGEQIQSVSRERGHELLQQYSNQLQQDAQDLLQKWELREKAEYASRAGELLKSESKIGSKRKEYSRMLKKLTELYTSRYILPYVNKEQENSTVYSNSIEDDELHPVLKQINSELQFSKSVDQSRLNALNEWKDAEYGLLDKRMLWEQKTEREYLSQLKSIKQQYESTEEQYEQLLQNIDMEYEQGVQSWAERQQELNETREREFKALSQAIASQQKETGRLLGQLQSAYIHSQALVAEAEAQIYAGHTVGYWPHVRSRELLHSAEIQDMWLCLIAESKSIPSKLLNGKKGLLEERIHQSKNRVQVLQSLVDFMEVPVEQRNVQQVKRTESENGESYVKLLSEEGVLSKETSEAFIRYIESGMKLSVGEESEGQIYDSLTSELHQGKQEHSQLVKEYEQLCDIISEAQKKAVSSTNLHDEQQAIRKQAELDQVVRQLEQAYSFLTQQSSFYHTRSENKYSSLYTQLQEVLPILSDVEEQNKSGYLDNLNWKSIKNKAGTDFYSSHTDRLQRDALVWAHELEIERQAGNLDAFLQECALALYHQDKELIEPGYFSSNQNFKKLQEKLGSSPDAYLKEKAKSAYTSVTKDQRTKRLFGFYSVIIDDQPDPSKSILSKAAVEDLGEILFSEIVDHAGRRYDELDEKRDEYLDKAEKYATMAAACYASLNIPAGAALSAIAANYSVKASDTKAERDDIGALRNSVRPVRFDGDAERRKTSKKIASIADYSVEICSYMDKLHVIESAVHSDVQWKRIFSSGKGDFSFTQFFKADQLGEPLLYDFMNEQQEDNKHKLFDYIDSLLKAARGELNQIDEVRSTLNKELVPALGEFAACSGSPLKIEKKTYEEIAKLQLQIKKLCSKEQAAFYLSGGAELSDLTGICALIHCTGDTKLLEARRRGELSALRLNTHKALWEQLMKLKKTFMQNSRNNQLQEMRDAASEWDREFKQEYTDQQACWDRRIRTFHQARTVWLQEAIREQAGRVSSTGAKVLNLDPSAVSARLTLVPLDHIPKWEPPQATFSLESSHSALDLFTGLEQVDFQGLFPELEDTKATYSEYRKRVNNLYKETSRRAEKIAFETGIENFSRSLKKYQQRLLDALQKANESVENSLHTVLISAGFQKCGPAFQRNAIVDITYFKHERELQSIGPYNPYRLPDLEWERAIQSIVSWSSNLSSAEEHYHTLLDEVEAQQKLLFGGYDTEMDSFLDKVNSTYRTNFTEAAQNFSSSPGYSSNQETEGLFNWHVGYAPKMSESDPEKIETEGYGESGRIFTKFYRYEVALGKGLAMMDQAGWDRRLWDDDKDNDGQQDGWLKAATIRSLSDLGVQTAASLSMGPLAAAFVGLTDDALFAYADYSEGYKTWDESLFSFGKKAAVQTASLVSGELWDSLQAVPVWEEKAALFRNVLPSAGKTATEKLIQAGSTGIEYTNEDGFNWDESRFEDILFDPSNALDIGLSAFEAYSDAVLHNSVINSEHTYGFSNIAIEDLKAGIDVGQGILSGGIEFAIDGETTWNIFGIEGNGLLEWHLSQDSSHLALGSNGRSISPTRILELYKGMRLLDLQQSIDRVGRQYNSPVEQDAIARMLRFQAGFGDEHSRGILKKILNGELKVRFLQEEEYRAETRLGNDGPKEVLISLSLHDGLCDPSLALTLQHEAHRDGQSSPDNADETLEAIMAHASMATKIYRDPLYDSSFLFNDGTLLQDMAALAAGDRGIAALMNAYDSSGDYWRINSEGTLLWDGSHHLWGENGILVETHGPGSFSQDVADYMGISRPEALKLMRKAGFMWNETLGTYQKSESNFNLKVRPELAAEYMLLKNFAERTDTAVSLTNEKAYAWALREQYYQTRFGDQADPGFTEAMEQYLADPETFESLVGLSSEDGFDGILSSGNLREYSQQWLEASANGSVLDAGAGNGYCLAQSIAAHYVDTFSEVDWKDVEQAFGSGDWGDSFDPSTGWVGDKQSFSAELSKQLGVDAYAREYRFDTIEEVNSFLADLDSGNNGFDDISYIADYGSHFTHVRQDGIELNSYNGWKPPESGPEGWRVYGWDFTKN